MEDRTENHGLQFNFDALVNTIILAAVEDLGHDALSDEGAVTWMNAGNIDADTLEHGIDVMPLNKHGMPDARPAMRRIMESLEAGRFADDMVDIEVHFDHIPVANLDTEPNSEELAEIEAEEIEID
tara:strand:+ start:285 stop:662 length:378 start_codon:yes stop_codon:yes gene_type:complete